MTIREYTADTMVKLPWLSAQHTVALGSEILTALQSLPPIPLLQKPQTCFVTALDALKKEVAPGEPDVELAIEIDRRLDAGWSGLSDVLAGWVKLPDSVPQAAKARTLQQIAFEDGMKFTKVDFRSQWTESESRLNKLSEEPNTALVREVGAEPFVAEVREAHRLFGQAIGITSAREDGPAVRSRMLEFSSALRSLILHVVVYAESGESGSEEVAQKLLAPVVALRSQPRRSKKSEAPTDVTPSTDSEG